MSDKVDIFMPLFVADYLADTTDLTAEEHGAYMLLLMALWRQDGRLENNPHRLARTAKVPADRWPDVWLAIERFFDVSQQAVTQGRLIRELEKARGRKAAAAENGAKGAAARWGGHSQAMRTPLTNDVAKNGSSPSPSQDLSLSSGSVPVLSASVPDPEARAIPVSQAPYVPPRDLPRVDRFAAATSGDFQRVYDAYPRKDDRVGAEVEFQVAAALHPGGEKGLADEILAAFPTMLKRHPYNGPNATRPFLGTVIKKARWRDQESAPDDAAPAATGPPSPGKWGHARAEDQKHTKSGEVEV